MRQLRLGIAGLGRGFMLMLPTLAGDPRLKLVAAADPQPGARERFAAEFAARTYASSEEMCRDPDVEAVYIATPHQFHAAHAIAAAAAGKPMLIEKPMAVTLDDCARHRRRRQKARVPVVDRPQPQFRRAYHSRRKRLIDSGAYGRLRLVTAFNYTDFMYRPRRPEELDTAQGGGVIFNQGAHQIDVARYLAGGLARFRCAPSREFGTQRARPRAPIARFVTFADGAAANLTYSGYAHFDSDEFCGWIAESGLAKDPSAYGGARRALRSAADEAALKARQGYGGAPPPSPQQRPRASMPHFGVVIASAASGPICGRWRTA